MQTFSWKRFGYWLIAFLLIYQAVSYAVDPLGLNFRFTHPGLNAIKPAAVGFERKLKPLRIKKVQPQTLILGSSRAAYGIDPDRLHGFPYPIFNAAVEYGQLYEMYRMLEYAVEIAPIKEVVLLLHYYNFNQSSGIRDFAPIFSRGEMRPLVEAHTLAYFSSDAAWGIFKTCFANLAMNHKKGSTEKGYIFNNSEKQYSHHDAQTRRDLVSSEAHVVLDYTPGLQIIRQIRALCHRHRIELHAILGPFPPEQIQLRKELGTWSAIEAWKAALDKEIAYTDYYQDSAAFDAKDFYDRIHFSVEAGVQMVNALKEKQTAIVTKASQAF